MTDTLLTPSQSLNGSGGDRQARAAAWPEHPAVANAVTTRGSPPRGCSLILGWQAPSFV